MNTYMYRAKDDKITKKEAEMIAERLLDEVRFYGTKIHNILIQIRNDKNKPSR